MFLTELRRGWRNLLATIVGVGSGVAIYTPLSSIFFHALERDFGWSKATAAISLIAMPLTGAALPFAGWAVDRFGVRLVTAVSAVFAALCCLALSRMNGVPAIFYAGVIGINVLGCATGPVSYTRLVVSDFRASRGLALAVSLLGIAIAAITLPPLIGHIVGRSGWRAGYVGMALLTIAGAVVAQLLMRPRDAEAHPEEQEGLGVRQALSSAPFWILGFAMLAISIGTLGLVSQFQSLFIERGLTIETATYMISLLGVSVVVTRLIIGRILDLPRPTRWAAFAIGVAAVGPLLLIPEPVGLFRAAMAVILVGASAGAELDLMAYFCSGYFGLRRYGAIYGLLFAFHYSGIAIGGIAYGLLRDRQGVYDGGLLMTASLLGVAALLFVLLGRHRPIVPSHAASVR